MITVLPSPLLPGEAYADLLAGLRRAGAPATVLEAGLHPGGGPGELVDRWSAAAPGAVLLAHSNAGYLAPLVRERLSAGEGERQRTRIVFMDAALPAGAGDFRPAPTAFRAHLATLADDRGLLPPWTRWWARGDLADVIPEGRFDALDAACPRLPLAYFDTLLRAPDGWDGTPHAYLAFGDTYAEELRFARTRRWPVTRLEGGHLAWLADPDGVAAAVLDLTSRLARAT
jgi:hypothetical protein